MANNKKLDICILSTGRFHLLDLARELSDLGHNVQFISYVPKTRCKKFGLPEKCHEGLFIYFSPLIFWQFYLPFLLPKFREKVQFKVINYLAIKKMKRCDLVIGMSGIYLEAFIYAKNKFGAQINLHRGSKHILEQDKILAKVKGAERPTKFVIQREISGYEIADYILIASKHVYDSFETNKSHQKKCKIISYGVDINQFEYSHRNILKEQRNIVAVYAGMWTYRKGCDLIIEVLKQRPDIEFIHVGDIVECPFPKMKNLKHIDRVDQNELKFIYARADFFVLASREDGFGVVLSQALASGLPVLATEDTGAPDLKLSKALEDNIQIVKSDNFLALMNGFDQIVDRFLSGPQFCHLSKEDRELLSWSGYGLRYNDFLAETLL